LPLIHPKMTQIFQNHTLLAYRHPEEIAVWHGVSGVYLTQVHALGRTSRICDVRHLQHHERASGYGPHFMRLPHLRRLENRHFTALVVSVSVALVFPNLAYSIAGYTSVAEQVPYLHQLPRHRIATPVPTHTSRGSIAASSATEHAFYVTVHFIKSMGQA
jgi:hypothetical protein